MGGSCKSSSFSVGPSVVEMKEATKEVRERSPATMARVHRELLQSTMLYRDLIFTEAEWEAHHSWKRYLPEPLVTFQLLRRLSPLLAWVFLISMLCYAYQEYREDDMPDLDDFQPTIVYTVCSFALSLLLVFKTNACYGRWAEARAAWGTVYHGIRSLICKTQALTRNMPPRKRLMFVRWVIAFPYVLRSHLLSYVPGSLVLEPLLTDAEVAWLMQRPHLPVSVIQMLGALLNTVDTEQAIVRANLHIELQHLVGASTTCERLARTPIPTAYSRHTVRFLIVYLSFLPLGMWSTLGWLTVIVVPVVAFLLMGIENIGNQIENPVLVLPMGGYCSKVHKDVIGMTEHWVQDTDQEANRCFESLYEGKIPEWQQSRLLRASKQLRSSHELDNIACGHGSPSPAEDAQVQAYRVPELMLTQGIRDASDDDAPSDAMQSMICRANAFRHDTQALNQALND